MQTDLEQKSLHDFAEFAYLNYSMYVILDRALPYIGDGLKPVQRRIVYAMSELGLKHTSKFKKSARTVGDVLGKFHPHGDQACYEAMVLMAQPFSYRYPLIEGQGNFGSIDDPKSFAAMRYTESKLSHYSKIFLEELEQGTVNWLPNFDGTLNEPEILPARLPNLLINGSSGIAVGMATDIPPHNLREIVQACTWLLDHPNDESSDAIYQFIEGPDFPGGGEIITPKEEIKQIYNTGNGTLRARAVYQIEDEDIIITALPPQTSGTKVLEQIAKQIQQKQLPTIVDIRDESDHESPIRLVLCTKSNRVDIEATMAHLFATTDLEKTCRINLNVIGLNQKPQVKSLRTILVEWLVFRTDIVKKRLSYRLQQICDRLEILTGLLIAYLNLDEVIHIIRTEDEPKIILIQRFKLTDKQADAILDIKLRHLAQLEQIKIQKEEAALLEEKKWIEKTMKSPEKISALIKTELLSDAEEYGDNRRTKIISRSSAQAFKETDLIPNEPITIILSKKNWIRAAKGHDINPLQLSYKSGDEFKCCAYGKTNDSFVLFDSTGRSYTLSARHLPSARTQGEPLSGHLNLPETAECVSIMTLRESGYVLLASTFGYGFLIEAKELYAKNRNGKLLLNVSDKASALSPIPMNSIETDKIAIATNEGYLLIFSAKELPILSKGKGNKMIHIPSKKLITQEEIVKGITVLPENASLTIYAGQRHLTLKPNDLKHYENQRAKRGGKLPRGFTQINRLTVL